MDTRVAVISIIVENPEAIVTLNDLLHEAGNYIIGRMGIPYREKGINIISIAIDAPQDIINTLAGKLGKVEGISFCRLTSRDVVRHPLVQKIVKAYDEYEGREKPERRSYTEHGKSGREGREQR